MFAVFIPIILLSGTIFWDSTLTEYFTRQTLQGLWLHHGCSLWRIPAVFCGYRYFFARSNGAAIATNICLVSISPTCFRLWTFCLEGPDSKFSPFWIGRKAFFCYRAFRCRQDVTAGLELSQQLYM